jgi:hypothetical protein
MYLDGGAGCFAYPRSAMIVLGEAVLVVGANANTYNVNKTTQTVQRRRQPVWYSVKIIY